MHILSECTSGCRYTSCTRCGNFPILPKTPCLGVLACWCYTLSVGLSGHLLSAYMHILLYALVATRGVMLCTRCSVGVATTGAVLDVVTKQHDVVSCV